jgi:hypothetical protein
VDLTAQAQLKAAARVLAAVPPGMVGTFARWDGASRALVTKSGVEIIMGDMEDVEAKLLLLEELWQDLAAQGLDPAVIDLRVLKNPVVRLRQP